MFERFTDRARKVMHLAHLEAHLLDHEHVGTEHILLGLVKEGSGNGATLVKNFDLDLRKVRLEVEKCVKQGVKALVMGRATYTPRAKKVIEYAIQESRDLGHNYIGTEHLLLGLLRENEGVAAQVLLSLGLNLEKVRLEVEKLVAEQNSDQITDTPTVTSIDKTEEDGPQTYHRACLHCNYGKEDEAIEGWIKKHIPLGFKIEFTELLRTVPPKHLFTGPESVDVFVVIWYMKPVKVS